MRVCAVLGASALIAVLVSSCNLMLEKTPLETIAWENDGKGFLQYKTNDATRLSLGTYYEAPTAQLVPTGSLVFQFRKVSGALTAPYGVLFGYQDGNNFYRLLISPESGYFRVDKKVAGVYSQICDWTDDYSFAPEAYGLGKTITFTVSEPAGGNYTLRFNSLPGNSYVFFDSSLPNTGSSGFYVITGDTVSENFPFDPVDVRFKITAPVVVP